MLPIYCMWGQLLGTLGASGCYWVPCRGSTYCTVMYFEGRKVRVHYIVLLPRGGRGRALLDPLLSQGGIFGSLGYYHEGGRGRALLDPLLSQGGIFGSLGYWAAGLRCIGYLSCPSVRASVFTFFGATTSQRPSYLIKTPHHHLIITTRQKKKKTEPTTLLLLLPWPRCLL